MFIVAYILFGIGAVLLILAVVAFFKLNVREAYDFTKNRRGPSNSPSKTARVKPRKQKREYSGERNIPDKLEQVSKNNGDDTSTGKIGDEEDSEQSTDLLKDDSEAPTGILEEDSEQATGILDEVSEQPTGILEEDSEKPTGILEEETEKPTGILEEDSEKPTGILEEGSEKVTDILEGKTPKSKETAKKPKVVKTKTKKSKALHKKEKESTFRFELIKDEIVIHTDESIT